jgi:hypothetical protein
MTCKKYLTGKMIVTNLKKLFPIGCVTLLLSSCQTIPTEKWNFTPDYVAPSDHQIYAQLQSIVVTPASLDERAGAMPKESELVPIIHEWERALSVALSQSKNFNSTSNNKVNLIVKILEIKRSPIVPFITAQSTTDVTARYQIVEIGTGKILYSKNISSRGIGSVFTNSGGIYGNIKNTYRVSENMAVRLNIENLILSLYNDH